MLAYPKSFSIPRIRFLGVLAIFSGLFWAVVSGPILILPIHKADLRLQDTVVARLPDGSPPEGLVFLDLDESSLDLSQVEPEEVEASRLLQLMEQDFPWSREVYAGILERLMEAGAKAVVFDIHFLKAHKGDEVLSQTLERFNKQVVIGAVIDANESASGQKTIVFSPPSVTIIKNADDPIIGYVNFWPDVDGVVRSADYSATPSTTAREAAREGEPVWYSLAARALKQVGREDLIPEHGSHLMKFHKPGSFPIYPVWSIFVPDLWERNLKNGEVFRDKIVLFGPTANRFRDVFPTPVLEAMPGPEIHLNALSAAMQNRFLHRPNWIFNLFYCLLASFAAGSAIAFLRQPMRSLFAVFALLALLLLLTSLLYLLANFLLPILAPGAAILTTGLIGWGLDFAAERKDKARVRRTLERYVSKDIVREVLDNPSTFLEQLGGVRKELTVLFSDLRGFTALTERSDPVLLVAQLNEYLREMVEIVFRHGGTVDKFIGDSVMAVWGSVLSKGVDQDARDACTAGAEMLSALKKLNEGWRAAGKTEFKIGIGIHSGEAIFGNMGSEQKMEPTVIGDCVNLTARLEGLCKQYGVPIVFSDEVRKALGNSLPVRTLDLVRVVGRSRTVEIFSLATQPDGTAWNQSALSDWENAVALFREARFQEAAELVEKVLLEVPGDFLAANYLDRCKKNRDEGVSADWSPVYDLTRK